MKRKGSSLIMVICVVALLFALTIVLVSQASAAYNLTSRNEKNDKVYLMAESGVQMGIDKIRSMMLSSDNDTVADANNIEPFPLDKTNGITTEVKFSNSVFNGKACIKITSTATDGKDSTKTKTISTDVEKNNVTNIYYDFLKNNLLTVLDDKKDSNLSFNAEFGQTPINGNGSIYLQGGQIQYAPSMLTFNPIENVKVNANKLSIDFLNRTIGDLFSDTLSKFTIDTNTKTYKRDELGWYNSLSQELYNDIKNKFQPDFHGILEVSGDNLSGFDNPPQYISGLGGSGTVATKMVDGHYVAVIKSTENCILPEFENTVEIKLFQDLYNEYRDSHFGFLIRDIDAYNYAIAKLNNMYKVYIVDGDVSILAEKLFISLGLGTYQKFLNIFDNYIIYSTGKVTFGAPANIDFLDSLWFNNSSIMAKQVQINNLNKFGLNFNSTLNSTYKDIYNSFLKNVFARQLIDYKTQYNLQVCNWEEK